MILRSEHIGHAKQEHFEPRSRIGEGSTAVRLSMLTDRNSRTKQLRARRLRGMKIMKAWKGVKIESKPSDRLNLKTVKSPMKASKRGGLRKHLDNVLEGARKRDEERQRSCWFERKFR